MKSRFGKKKFERYKKYVGEDEVGEYIRMFARKKSKETNYIDGYVYWMYAVPQTRI